MTPGRARVSNGDLPPNGILLNFRKHSVFRVESSSSSSSSHKWHATTAALKRTRRGHATIVVLRLDFTVSLTESLNDELWTHIVANFYFYLSVKFVIDLLSSVRTCLLMRFNGRRDYNCLHWTPLDTELHSASSEADELRRFSTLLLLLVVVFAFLFLMLVPLLLLLLVLLQHHHQVNSPPSLNRCWHVSLFH